ncbi:MAG: hypothetical protein HQK53_02670 [Oligoflexia bacterium]|nr:hypothetical protein [Oligoflexia bacterium]
MGGYDDVSTFAHESGHSMHSYFSNKYQPYINSDYSIFVAEVASTLNENLLSHYALKNITRNNQEKLFLLGSKLEGFRTTLFRQTLFAEFELKIHEIVEAKGSLSDEQLSKLYLQLLKIYYGHDQGICQIDDIYGIEWARIPHFYYDFYVFKYSTSLVASTAIAKAMREETQKGGTSVRDAYIKFLSSGSSKYPIELLKGVGVDMTTSKPFNAAIEEMNSIMDQIEKMIASTPQ